MSYLLKFNHKLFDSYAEEHLYRIFNIVIVLHLLAIEPLTASALSKVINPTKELERGRVKFDVYNLTDKLQFWGYIVDEIDVQKYGNTRPRYILTEKSKELIFIFPEYMCLGKLAYTEFETKCRDFNIKHRDFFFSKH